ncbi:helix-turn-helix domain-containing protein [Paenibacillus sp. MZ04-78.2]|uniref:helix-turn-helix domain-containing protein n=1 Tax=Paenibacillus sp. MZ04-78.2 TaxID=2962034 RepID=UPI0020B81697|nr:helix-turn-helix domain-containing protein [Paenibacillus sp. MZ04-78.2]MCP3773498.1 helix-turn-helix domain-containing protein [Paenibacillus sp. MZ04-78.2]
MSEIISLLENYPAMLDVNDVRDILRVGRDSAYKELNSGKFPVVRIGKQIRVAKPVFAKYLEQCNNSEKGA